MQFVQQDEVSDDLMTFHEKVNHMQELEEEIQDDQRVLIEVWLLYSDIAQKFPDKYKISVHL